MPIQNCLYCQGKLLHADPTSRIYNLTGDYQNLNYSPQELYKCHNCGLQCTQFELDKRNKYQNSGSSARPAEEELLQQAWELMQQKHWNDALDSLCKNRFPLKHPQVFLIYSNICQIAPTLLGDRSTLYYRWKNLNMFQHNLSCLNGYLSNADPEVAFNTAYKLFEALMLFGKLPIKRHINVVLRGPIYFTNIKRIAILQTLSSQLLNLAETGVQEHRAAYYKMALQLLYRCLELSREKNELIHDKNSGQNNPTAMRRQINASIAQVSDQLRKIDPKLVPSPPPAPPISPKAVLLNIIKGLLALLAVGAYFVAIHYIAALIVKTQYAPQNFWDYFYLSCGQQQVKDLIVANFFLHCIGFIILVFSFFGRHIALSYPAYEEEKANSSAYCPGNISLPNFASAPGRNAALLAENKIDSEEPVKAAVRAIPLIGDLISGNTYSKRCIYCGEEALIEVYYKNDKPLNGNSFAYCDANGSIVIETDHFFRCGNCGLCCTAHDLQLHSQNLKNSPAPLANPQREANILKETWDMIQMDSWDSARKALDHQKFPYLHPFEFMLGRSICSAAAYFLYPVTEEQASSLDQDTYDSDILKKRYNALDPLIESMPGLDAYLASQSPEDIFSTILRIYEMLRLFVGLPFKDYSRGNVSKKHNYRVVDYTHAKRLTIAKLFADQLEELASGDPQHRTEYLKMAAHILAECLTLTLRVNDELRPVPLESYSTIYEEVRVQFEEKIELLNAILTQSDPYYIPVQLPVPPAAASPEQRSAEMNITSLIFNPLTAFVVIGLLVYWFTDDWFLGLIAAAIPSTLYGRKETEKKLLQ